MPEFLILLLMQVTIFSSVTALILIAVKQIFKCRIPPLIGVILWTILLARLLCPIFPESRVSIYNFIPVGRNIMFTLTSNIDDEVSQQEERRQIENNPYVVHRKWDTLPADDTENVQSDHDAFTVGEYFADVVGEADTAEKSSFYADRINVIILVLYYIGISVSLTVSLVLYIRAKRRAMRTSLPCEDERLLQLYHETAEKLGIDEKRRPALRNGLTSMLIGCRHPSISCRDDMQTKEASMVFAHELIHYKYGDNPILLFSTIVACFFWYNPLIWVVRNILRDDLEVLCDARTLTYCKIPRTEYALLLCRSCAYAELAVGAGCHMSASGRRLKNRLRTISFEKHRRFLPKFMSVILCAAIMMICLTNPIVSQNSDYSVYIENYAALTGGNVRAMHLSEQETVSSYLGQISTLLKAWYGRDFAQAIGTGSLQNFKRICSDSVYIPKDVYAVVRQLRTDEPLTNKNCAVINDCVTRLLEKENIVLDADTALLPTQITAEDMESILYHLTEAEKEAVLACYHPGVAGAKVTFDAFYTDAMVRLICERIDDAWAESKFLGFYTEYDLEQYDYSNFSPAFRELMNTFDRVSSIYVCDASITPVEKTVLADILGAAEAGQQEDVYYLGKYEDGYTFDIIERLIRRGGFTAERMLAGYAEIGEAPYETDAAGGCIFTEVRDDKAEISGTVNPAVRYSVQKVYAMGLIDVSDGRIDLAERLSYGQGIAYAYRLAAAIIPVS